MLGIFEYNIEYQRYCCLFNSLMLGYHPARATVKLIKDSNFAFG